MSETTIYAIELSRDEREWLSELIEEKKLFYEKELIGCIGDDREWYLQRLPIAERVEQVFDTMFALRPDRAENHRIMLEAMYKCKRAMLEPMNEWKGVLEREALESIELLKHSVKEKQ